jgi:hypothetical protein
MIVDLPKRAVEVAMAGVTRVSVAHPFVGIARHTGLFEVYKEDFGRLIWSVPSYANCVTCCCVNREFFVAVIGTDNCSLVVNSLNKGSIVAVIDLEGAKPCLVGVTDGWGFIVTYAERVAKGKLEHLVFVFNINGLLVRKLPISFQITHLCTWTGDDGFDYMVVADENGKIMVTEVFCCDFGDGLYRCRGTVILLQDVKEIACAVVVASDGRILFIPNETAGRQPEARGKRNSAPLSRDLSSQG